MTVTSTPPVQIFQMVSCAPAESTKVTLVTVDSAPDQLTNVPTVLISVTLTPHAPTPTLVTHANVTKVSAVMDVNAGHHSPAHTKMVMITSTCPPTLVTTVLSMKETNTMDYALSNIPRSAGELCTRNSSQLGSNSARKMKHSNNLPFS